MCSRPCSVPVPVEEIDVDLYGLIDESRLQEDSLSLLNLTAEQQQVS